MALSNAARQRRFKERRIDTGEQVRFEFRVSAEEARAFRQLAVKWSCSQKEAFTRAVNIASEGHNLPSGAIKENLAPTEQSDNKETSVRASKGKTGLSYRKFGNGYSVVLGETMIGRVEKQGREWQAYAPNHIEAGYGSSRSVAAKKLLAFSRRHGLIPRSLLEEYRQS